MGWPSFPGMQATLVWYVTVVDILPTAQHRKPRNGKYHNLVGNHKFQPVALETCRTRAHHVRGNAVSGSQNNSQRIPLAEPGYVSAGSPVMLVLFDQQGTYKWWNHMFCSSPMWLVGTSHFQPSCDICRISWFPVLLLLTTCPPQTRVLPALHGKMVIPSGLRTLSRSRPSGSRIHGIPTFVRLWLNFRN